MPRDIKLSPKHGVNPSMGLCFYCNEPDGTIVLPGRLAGDAEAPRQAVWTREPCDKCKGYMAQGVILVQVRDGETGENPYRLGGWAVVKDDAIRRMVHPASLADQILKTRFTFVPDEVWKALGLDRTTPDPEAQS